MLLLRDGDAPDLHQVLALYQALPPLCSPNRSLCSFGSALEAATIWIYKILIDDVLVPRDFELLVWVGLAYLGLTLAEGVASFCEDYLSEWVGGRFMVSLRTEFFSSRASL